MVTASYDIRFSCLAKACLWSLWMLLSAPLMAQGPTDAKDTSSIEAIERLDQLIVFRPSVNNAYERFRLETDQGELRIRPNTPVNIKLGINYRFLSISIKLAPGFLPGNGDNFRRGKTRSIELGGNLIFKRWFHSIALTRIRGFYLENTGDYRNWQQGDPYLQFPDLVYTGIGGVAGYTFNPDFSLKSLYTQTERQTNSEGSFFMLLPYRYYNLDDRHPIGTSGSSQVSDNIEISFGAGYEYTFVFKEYFYTSAGLVPTVGFIHTWLTTRFPSTEFSSESTHFTFRWDLTGSIGYNGDRQFFGLRLSLSNTRYDQTARTIINHEDRVSYRLFWGIRFKAPAFLNKKMDQLSDRLPFI